MTTKIDDLVKKWESLEPNELEDSLNAKLTNHIIEFLGLNYQIKPTIEGGIQPDYLIQGQSKNPILVIETKKRTPTLANRSDQDFTQACRRNSSYKSAVGYDNVSGNGIKQYLSVKDSPAKYGLVFNGDFFQLFRRVDGLIVPLTNIQRVNTETLPKLIKQLKHYVSKPDEAFIISMWNRKGGVAKTTNIINMSAVLSVLGKRVLVVDFDPQTDLTSGLGLRTEPYKYKLLECFDSVQLGENEKTQKLLKDLIQKQEFKPTGHSKTYTISVLPGHKGTLDIFGESENSTEYPGGYEMPKKQVALSKLLSFISQDYDYIFIDTSPKADILTACALLAADGVIIPSDYDPETLRHARDISKSLIPNHIRSAKQKNQSRRSILDEIRPRILGLVFSNCSSLGVTMERRVDSKLEQLEIKVYQTKLRRYDSVPIAKFAHKPVIFHRPKSPASQLYNKLTQEIFIKPNFIER